MGEFIKSAKIMKSKLEMQPVPTFHTGEALK